MRTKKATINALFLICSHLLVSGISLCMRPIFVEYLTAEHLGVTSVLTNLMTLMSVTEAGVATSLAYRLYEAFSKEDQEEVCLLVNLYRTAYRIIGTVILLVGLAVLPLLKSMAWNAAIPMEEIYACYLIELLATVMNYYIGYYRLVYVSDQKEYICVVMDTGVSVALAVLQVGAVIFLRSYVVYTLLNAAKIVVPAVFLLIRRRRDYPYLRKRRLTKAELQERHFFSDIKNASIQQAAYVFYGGADSIIVSSFLGLTAVASFTNYTVITGFVSSMLGKLYKPLQAGVGNFIYSVQETEKRQELFYSLDLVNWMLNGFVFTSYLILFQPFITWWMGAEFLLPMPFVFFVALNAYIGMIGVVSYYFRTSVGEFDYDRKYVVASAVVNMGLSIILGRLIGVTGVILGTVAASSLIVYGRNKLAFARVLEIRPWGYYLRQLRRFLLVLVECGAAYALTVQMPATIPFFAVRVLVSFTLTVGVNFLLFRKSAEMAYFMARFRTILKK